MARVLQWRDDEHLSHVLFEPISRRSALIDPVVARENEYRQTLAQKGLTNLYVLYTGLNAFDPNLPGSRLYPGGLSDGLELSLGETRVHPVSCTCGRHQAYVCDGVVFSGDWWLPFGADRHPDTLVPFQDLPSDYVLYPGRVLHGVRISSLGQERDWLARSPATSGQGAHGHV